MSKTSDINDLIKGASISQLAKLFELDRRTVSDRLQVAHRSGVRNGFPIYKIADVAELLVSGYMSTEELSESQKRQRADKEKDYWDSQLKKQKFKENDGDLWRTDSIVEVLADLFKFFRESLVAFVDEIEHESGLPPDIVKKTKGFCDGMLIELREKLMVAEFDEAESDEDDDSNDVDESEQAELRELGLL